MMLSDKFNQEDSRYITKLNFNNLCNQSITVVFIGRIQLPNKQPRRYFNPEKFAQLIQSVKEHGILEPLLVRPLDNENYELVAGERRLKAASVVGLNEVPVVSLDLDDQQALQVALIENLQREELNPVEETEAILELLLLSLQMSANEVISGASHFLK
ncbi:ParB/RepB/Spo0J family partition protein [Nostoc sp. CCY 9925]|uniref:ParB/RepB/Spo0J family partition protein n=1 Tax=Nostoc sp. CCY 9925 TaxID=3103865 RepID=UPI0039C738A1